ncbi:CBS domain-containing protein [bacterium]|nr:CBS domain-containing protein [bacterium]
MKIKMVLSEKINRGHSEIYSINMDKTLQDASQEMSSKKIGGMLVIDPNSDPEYVGIITERDIMRCCSEKLDFSVCKVSKVMSKNLVVAKMDDEVPYVMSVMAQKHIRHIPVIEEKDGKSCIKGFLSIRDLLYAVIVEKDIRIQHLNDYANTYKSEVY